MMTKKSSSYRLNRREFVTIISTFLGSIMGAVLGIPIIGYILSPATKVRKLDDWISLGSLGEYPIGVPKFFGFTRTRRNGWDKTVNSYGVYVYRKSKTDIRVFSDICTHLACRVKWNNDLQEYISPCHDGHFAIDGVVTKGPPPRPLDQYEYKVENGSLLMHLINS